MTKRLTGKQRQMRWEWLAVAAIATAIVAVVAFATLQPVKVLPRIRLAPGFLLTDQDGQRFSNEDLRGQIVLYNFGYANCGADCDVMNAAMRALQEQLAGWAGDTPIHLVTISFDPARDDPTALRAYATRVGADGVRWQFAASDPARAKDIIGGGFEVYYEPNDQGDFKFDPAFFLVDGWGIIRAEYRREVPEPERVLKHIDVIQQEIDHSKGVAKVAYEAAHLFLCYAN